MHPLSQKDGLPGERGIFRSLLRLVTQYLLRSLRPRERVENRSERLLWARTRMGGAA